MAKIRFAVGIRHFWPFEYHHILMTVNVIAIILICLVLGACTASSTVTSGIYLLSLEYSKAAASNASSAANPKLWHNFANLTHHADIQVRTGFFSICLLKDGFWDCSSDSQGLAQQVSASQDPLNLISLCDTFKSTIVFPGLLITAVVLCLFSTLLMATFPGWHEEVNPQTGSDIDIKPFPSRPTSQSAFLSQLLSSIMALVAVLWQHIASVAGGTMVQSLTFGAARSSVGGAAIALGWVSFGLLMISTIGLIVMILSIQLLDHLTDEQTS